MSYAVLLRLGPVSTGAPPRTEALIGCFNRLSQAIETYLLFVVVRFISCLYCCRTDSECTFILSAA
jgi:hypothetical protein